LINSTPVGENRNPGTNFGIAIESNQINNKITKFNTEVVCCRSEQTTSVVNKKMDRNLVSQKTITITWIKIEREKIDYERKERLNRKRERKVKP